MKILKLLLITSILVISQSCATTNKIINKSSNINDYIMPQSCLNKTYHYTCTQGNKIVFMLNTKYSVSGDTIILSSKKILQDNSSIEQNEKLIITKDHFVHINKNEIATCNGDKEYSIEYITEKDSEYHKKLLDKDGTIENIYGLIKSESFDFLPFNNDSIKCLVIEVDEKHDIYNGQRRPASNNYHIKYIYGYQIGLIKTVIVNDKNTIREIILNKVEE